MKTFRLLSTGAAALLVIALGLRLWSAFHPAEPLASADKGNPSLASVGGIQSSNGQPEAASGGIFRRVAGTPLPALDAHAALIADPESGEILFNFNPGMRWPMASLTKLMTAHIVLTRMNLDQTYVLAPADFADGQNQLTLALAPGEAYSGKDLLRIMLTSSANEAAECFARYYGRDAFIAAMNAEAAAWNLPDTHFADPSGLSAGNQTTSRDLAALVKNLWQLQPDEFQLTRSASVTVTELKTGRRQVFRSTSEFAGRADYLGGKTGTTPEAGENLLSIFSYDSHPVMIMLFGATGRFAETLSLLDWFKHDFIPSY